jgi:hypothetical protein
MAAFCVRGWTFRPLWLSIPLVAVLALLALPALPAAAAEPIAIRLDQAQLIKLPERADTIVIGDPLIADMTVRPNGIAVLTGRGYGATNVIVMDRDGAVLLETKVEVRGATDPSVVVYRGVDRSTYSCTPDCSPRLTLGDEQQFFRDAIGETTDRNNAITAVANSAESKNTPGIRR